MAATWGTKRVLIVVRTYPAPATKSIEASCNAGITDEGKWIRLFPIPFRLMAEENRFSKWQWISTDAVKATSDARLESFKLNSETIQPGERIGTADGWRARCEIIKPLARTSMCQIRRELDEKGSPTLGVFRPGRIKRLVLEDDGSDWTPEQRVILSQDDLFQKTPTLTLEKIPFKFKYEFVCAEAGCCGHTMSCTDWEMAEAYRRWRQEYRNNWEAKFRQRFEQEMIYKNDTNFFVGTIHQHPKNWIIVGLFYPPKQAMSDLFD